MQKLLHSMLGLFKCKIGHSGIGLALLGCLLLPSSTYQSAPQLMDIYLENPSFEDRKPRPARLPRGWHTCSQPGVSPPDLHPSGVFQVRMKPFEGKTYVGMVVRPDGTRENIAQELPQMLEGGAAYRFSLHAALSPHYLSFDPETGAPLDFNHPACVEIWGSKTLCAPGELLARSAPVEGAFWRQLDFVLHPSENYRYLRIEAAYIRPDSTAYGGHVLVDACSPVRGG